MQIWGSTTNASSEVKAGIIISSPDNSKILKPHVPYVGHWVTRSLLTCADRLAPGPEDSQVSLIAHVTEGTVEGGPSQ